MLNIKGYLLKPVCRENIKEVINRVIRDIEEEKEQVVLRSLYNTAILSQQQEHFLKSIINGTISYKDNLYERLDNLNLACLKHYFKVAVCNFEPADNKNRGFFLPESIIKKSNEYWNKLGFPTISHIGYIIIFICAAGPVTKNDCNHYLKGFKSYMENQACLNDSPWSLTIGVGNTYNDICKASHSYSEALFAHSYKYFKGVDSVIYYQELLPLQVPKQLDYKINEVISNIINNIYKNEMVSLHANMHTLFGFIEDNAGYSATDTKFICLDIIFTLLSKIEDRGLLVGSLNKIDIARQVNSTKALSELKSFFLNTIGSLIEQSIKSIRDNNDRFIVEAKRYIYENLSYKITLEDISDHLHLNPNYFSGLFRKKTGKTFSDYIVEIRMEKARELLINPEYSIKEIATKVGYDDYSYFCKIFKSREGVTPLKYRSRLFGGIQPQESGSKEPSLKTIGGIAE
ncbi:MAG: helix-turn-helix transcriptional regulator [Clostridiaceae bacterium]|nr:helix-turn-helix transcriptional regulator [Clostridiaceae bacterium]